jgi:hypothetical protein
METESAFEIHTSEVLMSEESDRGHLTALLEQSIEINRATGEKVDRMAEKVGGLDREIGGLSAGLKAQGDSLQRLWQRLEIAEKDTKDDGAAADKEKAALIDRVTKLEERTITKTTVWAAAASLAGALFIGLPPLIDLVHGLLHPGSH